MYSVHRIAPDQASDADDRVDLAGLSHAKRGNLRIRDSKLSSLTAASANFNAPRRPVGDRLVEARRHDGEPVAGYVRDP
jgi:hypothetical protein